MQVRLKVLAGTHEGKEINVKDERFFIGRGDSCQLRPKSESISRKHCAIIQKDGRVIVADLKSRNGTFVNGVQLEAERGKILKSGDMLRVGQLEFQVVIEVSLGGAKRPEVQSVKDAVARVAESAAAQGVISGDTSTSIVDIDSWLNEPDSFDRNITIASPEPETQLLANDSTEDTTRIVLESGDSLSDVANDNSTSGGNSVIRRPDKKGPIKLPKHNAGPSTKNSKDAATDALKKYFGGR